MKDTQDNMHFPGQYDYVRKGRGAGFWIAVGLASFFFLCSVFFFILFAGTLILGKSLISGAAMGDKRPFLESVVSGRGEKKVAIIPVKGILSNESTESILIRKPSIVDAVKQQIEWAAEDAAVVAVVLEVDTPGGGITASDIIYNQIVKFREETDKKVVVYMQDIAASGGYYISSAADVIVAHPTTITGSIGVIMPLINVAELIDRYGIVDNSIVSGDMKKLGSPFKKMTPEEAAVLKGIVDEMYMQFIKVVARGRNLDIETVKKMADGRIYTGRQAMERGLIDKLGYLEDAIDIAKKLAKIEEATVVRYKEQYGLASLLGLMSGGFLRNTTIKLDIDQIPGQLGTKPMYLWIGSVGRE